MKVLIASPCAVPSIGGVQIYVHNLAKGLMANGWDVVVVSSTEEKLYHEKLIDGIRHNLIPYTFKLSNTPINPRWLSELSNLVKKEKPDIINGQSPVPFMADIAAISSGRIPFVLTYHAGDMKKNSFLPDMMIKAYQGVFLPMLTRKAVAIICSSAFVRSSMFPHNENAVVISPGVDLRLFTPGKARKEDIVLFVGSLDQAYAWKGLDILIDAMAGSRHKLVVVGDGDKRSAYEGLCRSHKVHAEFTGRLSGRELVKQYQRAYVTVLPSVTQAESFGMVLIESMACRTPVIGSDIGGIPSVIEDGKTGLLFKPGNSTDLKVKIESLFTDRNLARTLASNGREQTQKKYSWKSIADRTDELFGRVLAK